MAVRPTHFQIGTIIITLGLPIESHHRTSSSPLLRTFLLLSSDRTNLSTESGSGPIQLARARYRTACRSVAESPAHYAAAHMAH